MRRLLLLLLASSAWLDASRPSAAQVTNPIANMPFIAGELSVLASRCGLRDKVWATRLVGRTEYAIQHLNWSVVTPQTGETEESLTIRIQEGQQDGIRTLAGDRAGTCAKLTPERLAKFDKIVAGTTPMF